MEFHKWIKPLNQAAIRKWPTVSFTQKHLLVNTRICMCLYMYMHVFINVYTYMANFYLTYVHIRTTHCIEHTVQLQQYNKHNIQFTTGNEQCIWKPLLREVT